MCVVELAFVCNNRISCGGQCSNSEWVSREGEYEKSLSSQFQSQHTSPRHKISENLFSSKIVIKINGAEFNMWGDSVCLSSFYQLREDYDGGRGTNASEKKKKRSALL